MTKKKIIHDYKDRGVKPYNVYKKDCIITDLDGTLSLINGRGYYDADKYDTDLLNHEVHGLLKTLMKNRIDCDLIVITGRMDGEGRETTSRWLNSYDINYDKLLMRKKGDYRRDYDAKSDIIKELQKEYNIICALDDKDSSAQAFRDNGVFCLQVWRENENNKK